MRADLAGATNANVYTLTRCGREFLLRFLFPSRERSCETVVVGDVEGRWKEEEEEEEVKDTSRRDSDVAF